MTTWILILFFHVGPFADGNSNAVTSIPGFASQKECIAAGQQARSLTNNTVKESNFVCVKQTAIEQYRYDGNSEIPRCREGK